MKGLIDKLYKIKEIVEGNKELFITGASIVASYGVSLATNRGDIFGPTGHILMGPFFKEVGDKIHSYIQGKNKTLYEIISISGFSSLFQLLKYLNCMPLPGIGNEFEVSKIVYSIVSGLIAIGYEKKR